MFVSDIGIERLQIEHWSLCPVLLWPQEQMSHKLACLLGGLFDRPLFQHFLHFNSQILTFCLWETWREWLPDLCSDPIHPIRLPFTACNTHLSDVIFSQFTRCDVNLPLIYDLWMALSVSDPRWVATPALFVNSMFLLALPPQPPLLAAGGCPPQKGCCAGCCCVHGWGIPRTPHQPPAILSSTPQLARAPLWPQWALYMAGCWQINYILTNIGHRNSIRIWNQYPFFWNILIWMQFICFIIFLHFKNLRCSN